VKRVASKLRVPAPRLEAYLTSREDLLDLMLDGAFAEIDPADTGEDWRSRLRALAHATQITAQRHPWLRLLAGTRTPCGPHGLRHSERALAAVDGLGLDASTMTQVVNTVLAYVYGYVQLEMVEHPRKADADAEQERRAQTARYLMEQVRSGDYPTLARVFSDASLTATGAFESGLEYVLDGVADRVAAASAGASAAASTATSSGAGPRHAAGEAAPDPADGAESMADNEASTDASAGAGKRGRLGRRRGA
jgi:hypothetical protein